VVLSDTRRKILLHLIVFALGFAAGYGVRD
jgi:hypothetical protein